MRKEVVADELSGTTERVGGGSRLSTGDERTEDFSQDVGKVNESQGRQQAANSSMGRQRNRDVGR